MMFAYGVKIATKAHSIMLAHGGRAKVAMLVEGVEPGTELLVPAQKKIVNVRAGILNQILADAPPYGFGAKRL